MIEEVRGEYQFRIKVRSPRHAREMLREWRESLPALNKPAVEPIQGVGVGFQANVTNQEEN